MTHFSHFRNLSIEILSLRSLLLAATLSLVLFSCEKPVDEDIQPVQPAQNISTGWIGNENSSNIPNEVLLFGSGSLPSRVDLSQYMPPVGNQGQTGTCVAWALGYYQRTALQAIRLNQTASQLQSSNRQFSPKDLFWSIPNGPQKGANCDGTHFEVAYDRMLQRGVATMQTVPFQNLGNCSSTTLPAWNSEAGQYKIESYRQVPVTLSAIKTKLAEKRPLTFGAMVGVRFSQWSGSGVMRAANVLAGSDAGGHAMTIVGYDDTKSAFRILNSWGTGWGDGGYAWVDYSLMTNPQFTKYVFVAYDKPAENPVNPNTGTTSENVAVVHLEDNDDSDQWDPLMRKLSYNLKNIGGRTINASKDWHVLYLYVNAFDANDYGVILHRYITNDFGTVGQQGAYTNGLGISSSRWINVNISTGQTLGTAMFGSATSRVNATFSMPRISGYYYLVMIADAFDDLNDDDRSNNMYFLTGQNGRPVFFQNGIGQGLHSGSDIEVRADNGRSPHTPVTPENLNAYRPEEIRQFLLGLKREGKLLPAHTAETTPDQAQ